MFFKVRLGKRIIATFLMVILIMGLNTNVTYAHKMWIEAIEEGKIQVFYGDGSSPSFGDVILYKEGYIEVYRGTLNEDGTFILPTDVDAYLMVVEDGIGHRARWRIGDETSLHSNNILMIVIVAAGFIVVAYVFHRRSLKRKTMA